MKKHSTLKFQFLIMILKTAKIIKTHNLFRNQFNLYFCTINNLMKYLRDRALLASNIIKRIRSKNAMDELNHLPLHESIIKYLESASGIEDKAR